MKNIKKGVSVLLCLAMIFAMAACGEKEPEKQAETGVDLQIVIEEDDSMINTYTLLAVDPAAPFVNAEGVSVTDVAINTVGAEALINWMLSEGAELAGKFGYEDYGEYLFYLKDDRPTSTAAIPMATEETKKIRMSTTTSVNDSGLLGYLLPIFEQKYGYSVEVYSAGTGKSIANAKAGNADLILVHAKAQEETFVADGFAKVIDGQSAERLSYMYNFFVLCGPKADPQALKGMAVKDAFKKISDNKAKFVSRGDSSGTHTKELALWPESLGITADASTFAGYQDWYISANSGMGACLLMASEQGAYILSDKATFLTFVKNNGQI